MEQNSMITYIFKDFFKGTQIILPETADEYIFLFFILYPSVCS